jgi:thiamine pyrophosphate-dependent acetolactate synthase large subunit-like protein
VRLQGTRHSNASTGLLGTKPSEELMEEIDTLLMVGTNFPYTKHLPAPSKVRVAQIEADPIRAGARVPTEVPVVGDAKLALQGLLPLLKPRSDTRFLQKYQKAMGKWRENMAALQNPKRDPIALPVKIVISNNNSLGQILWEQMVLGYPEHGVRYPEPFVDYAALATANGALGIKVERARDVHKAVQRALSHNGPALVDVNVNPDEPPLPGKVEYQQAKKFAEAFLKGQPRKATIATTQFGTPVDVAVPAADGVRAQRGPEVPDPAAIGGQQIGIGGEADHEHGVPRRAAAAEGGLVVTDRAVRAVEPVEQRRRRW